jgi:sugar/nucleoside kinase (ribokinase family)
MDAPDAGLVSHMSILDIRQNRKTIVGVGSALVDLLAREPDDFIETLGVAKGGMNLVDSAFLGDLINRASSAPLVVPGGSACNTAMGVARLGGKSRFVGKLGKDDMGGLFIRGLQSGNVDAMLFDSDLPTGCVLSVITPDTQRSMFTCLGAASEMQPDEITSDIFSDAAMVHVEGYLVFNPELLRAVLSSAKTAGALVSLDLASFNVVEQAGPFLKAMVAEYVDILIANEDEARAYTGYDAEESRALEALAKDVTMAVLKLGAKGSRVAHKGNTIEIAPLVCDDAVDSTGAGDLWASGFLYGLAAGFTVEKSGEIASACGREVCRVIGAGIPDEGWERIRKII